MPTPQLITDLAQPIEFTTPDGRRGRLRIGPGNEVAVNMGGDYQIKNAWTVGQPALGSFERMRGYVRSSDYAETMHRAADYAYCSHVVYVDWTAPVTREALPVFSLATTHKDTNMLTANISRKKDGYTYIYVKSPQLAQLIDGMRTNRSGIATYNWEMDNWEYRKESNPSFRSSLAVYKVNEDGLNQVGFTRSSRPFTFDGRRASNLAIMLLATPDLAEGYYLRSPSPHGVDALRGFATAFRKGVEDLITMSKEISITLNLTTKPVAAAAQEK